MVCRSMFLFFRTLASYSVWLVQPVGDGRRAIGGEVFVISTQVADEAADAEVLYLLPRGYTSRYVVHFDGVARASPGVAE